MDNFSRLSQEAEQIKKKKGYFISPYEWNEMMKMAGKISELLPVKRTEKKYIIFPASNQPLLAVFHAARHNSCFSMGVSTPKLRCTLLVL